jgi:Escherichia/Staphylococcus phage prohead protease
MNTAGIEGYASLFGVADMTGDVVAAGAFTRSLRVKSPAEVKLLYQHDAQEPIGALAELQEDERGLFVAGDLNLETQRGSEAYALLRQGALTGLSIGFNVVTADARGRQGRLITEIDLWEISLVTFPMLPGASAWAADPAPQGALVRTLINGSRLFA